MTTTLKEQFNTLIQSHAELRAKFQKDAQNLLKQICKDFFEKNPEIKLISWTQYTPYFNDGDTCTFRVNDIYFSNAEGDDVDDITGWGEYDGENEDVFSDSAWGLKYHKVPNVNITQCEELSNILSHSDMEEVMLEMFGDHSAVRLTVNGFDITDYDHD